MVVSEWAIPAGSQRHRWIVCVRVCVCVRLFLGWFAFSFLLLLLLLILLLLLVLLRLLLLLLHLLLLFLLRLLLFLLFLPFLAHHRSLAVVVRKRVDIGAQKNRTAPIDGAQLVTSLNWVFLT